MSRSSEQPQDRSGFSDKHIEDLTVRRSTIQHLVSKYENEHGETLFTPSLVLPSPVDEDGRGVGPFSNSINIGVREMYAEVAKRIGIENPSDEDLFFLIYLNRLRKNS